MTIREISKQLFKASVNGYFNGEQFTQQWLEHYLNTMLVKGNPINNEIFMEITLPDGNWFFTVSYIPNCNTYGYYIPETREQEKQIINRMTQRITGDY